jgi:hypothetical protein
MDRLLQIQECWQLTGRATHRSRQAKLRHIVGEDTINIVEFCAGDRFLRLHHFHILANAGGEALAGEFQRLSCNILIAPRYLHLAAGCRKIEEGVTNIAFNPTANVGRG